MPGRENAETTGFTNYVGDGPQAPVTVATDPARYFMKSHEIVIAQLGDTNLQQRGFFRLIEINEPIRFGQREVNPKQKARLDKLRGIARGS